MTLKSDSWEKYTFHWTEILIRAETNWDRKRATLHSLMWGPEVSAPVHLGRDLWGSWQIGLKRKRPWVTQHSSHSTVTSDAQFRREEKAIKVQQKQAVTTKKNRVWYGWNFICLLSKSRMLNVAPALPIKKKKCSLLIFYPFYSSSCDHAECTLG